MELLPLPAPGLAGFRLPPPQPPVVPLEGVPGAELVTDPWAT